MAFKPSDKPRAPSQISDIDFGSSFLLLVDIDAKMEERVSGLANNLDTRFANLANELRKHFTSLLLIVLFQLPLRYRTNDQSKVG